MRPFRIAATVFGALFIFFAGMQLNDPDPELWVGTYVTVGVVSFLAASGVGHPAVSGLLALALAGLFGSIFEPGRAIDFDDEIIREELGVALALAWMVIVAVGQFLARRRG